MKNQVKMRISTKIIAAITVITLFTAAFIGIIVGIQVTGTVGDLSTQYATMQVQQETNEINEGFTQIEMAVGQFSRQIADTVDVDKAKSDIEYLRDLTDEYEEMFREFGQETGATNSIYAYFNVDLFGDAADCWVYGDDFARQDMIEASYYDGTQDWYYLPVRDGITRWTDPYAVVEGEAAGQLVTSYVTPIEKDGVIIGMLGMDMNLNNAQEVLYAVTLFETGYIYMMQPDGTLLIHERLPWEDTTGDGAPDTPVNMLDVGDFQFLIDDFESEESGFTEYTRDDGADVFAAFSHLDNGWIIGSSIPKDEVYASVSRLIMIIVGIAIFALVVAIILAFVLSRTITRPILDVVNVAKKMSDGDFTERVECKTNDETKLLADAVNEMSDHVSGLIKDTKNVSTKIVTSASDLATMAEDATASAEQAARSVEEISKGTIDTAAEATKSSEAVTVMDDKFGEMMENSAIMQENAQEAIETNKAGLEALNLLKEKSEKGNESNQKISKVVKELASETTKITAIIGTISSIAEQTNLLALNASIEAARAGEAGKGFAVVAEEIRQLAEDSAKATQGISDIINKIEADTKNSVVVMEEVEEIALEQGVAVENVNTSFDSIFKAVENITNVVEDVIKALDVLNEQNSELVSVSSNISAVSEETAAATQEVNASMTMQENTMQEVSKSADMLNKMSVQLNEQIEQFKVN